LYKENFELKLRLYHLQDETADISRKTPADAKKNETLNSLNTELQDYKGRFWEVMRVAKLLRDRLANLPSNGHDMHIILEADEILERRVPSNKMNKSVGTKSGQNDSDIYPQVS
jgi:hypothetical protein